MSKQQHNVSCIVLANFGSLISRRGRPRLFRLPKSPLCTTSVRRILCADLWQHVTVFPDGCTYPCGGVSIEGLESGAMKFEESKFPIWKSFFVLQVSKALIVRHTCFCLPFGAATRRYLSIQWMRFLGASRHHLAMFGILRQQIFFTDARSGAGRHGMNPKFLMFPSAVLV